MLVAIAAKMDLNLWKDVERWLEKAVWQSRRSARVKALVVAVLIVEACSREKGKVSRPSQLQKIPLRYYIEFGPRNQESRVYFRMSSLNTVSR